MFSSNRIAVLRIALKLVALYFVFALGKAYADNQSSTLTVKPNRCIGLQQGQTCFATLKFKWATPASGDYCLFDERQPTPLVCWAGDTVATFTQKFESNVNVNYEIRVKISEKPVARTLVKVSWIYKSNNSSTTRWRLF